MSKVPPQQPYPNQQYAPQQYVGQPQPYPAGGGQHVTHTTVVVQDAGCCGPRGRVQWVAAYNLLTGCVNLLIGALIVVAIDALTYKYPRYVPMSYYVAYNTWAPATAGITITAGALQLIGGVILLVGLAKRNVHMFSAWLVVIVLYLVLSIAVSGYNIYFVSEFGYHVGGTAYVQVVFGVIILLLQGLCISAVQSYRRTVMAQGCGVRGPC